MSQRQSDRLRGRMPRQEPPGRAPVLNARIGIVATIVVGQLWALTIALDQWFSGESVWLLVAFQVLSFGVALAVWLAAPNDR